MHTVLLVGLLALEDLAPLVEAEVGVRCGEDLAVSVGRGEDERAHGLVELVHPVVRERGGRRGDGRVGRSGADLVLQNAKKQRGSASVAARRRKGKRGAHHEVVVLHDLVRRVVHRPPRHRLGLGERPPDLLEDLARAEPVPSDAVLREARLRLLLGVHVLLGPPCEVPRSGGHLDEVRSGRAAVGAHVGNERLDDVGEAVLEHARGRVLGHPRTSPVVLLIKAKVKDGGDLQGKELESATPREAGNGRHARKKRTRKSYLGM